MSLWRSIRRASLEKLIQKKLLNKNVKLKGERERVILCIFFIILIGHVCMFVRLNLAVEVEIVQIEVVCKDRPGGNIHLDFTVRHRLYTVECWIS